MSQGSPLSRRTFLTATANAAALAAASCTGTPAGGGASSQTPTHELVGDGRKRPILLRGGVVPSLDAKVSDFEKADVLINGRRSRKSRPRSPLPTPK